MTNENDPQNQYTDSEEAVHFGQSHHFHTGAHLAQAIDNSTITLNEQGKLSTISIYKVTIDSAESDPETAVSYGGACTGFTPATVANGLGSWANTFIGKKIRPCVVNNGKIAYWLSQTDLTKKDDGTTATLTGTDGDVCVAIPTIYLHAEKSGTKTTISFSESSFEDSKAYAHVLGTEVMPWLFVGMFEGTISDSKLRSIYSTSATPTVSQTLDTFQTAAAANGTGYSVETIHTYTLLNTLFMALFKTTDLQTAVGPGHTKSSNTAAIAIGQSIRAEASGMNYGTSADTGAAVRALWIENPWGNIWKFAVGCYHTATNKLWINITNKDHITHTAPPATIPANYTEVSGLPTANGYVKEVLGSDPVWWWPKITTGGSSSTYVPDYHYTAPTTATICVVGGYWSDAAGAGPFCARVTGAAATTSAYLGARPQILSAGV